MSLKSSDISNHRNSVRLLLVFNFHFIEINSDEDDSTFGLLNNKIIVITEKIFISFIYCFYRDK